MTPMLTSRLPRTTLCITLTTMLNELTNCYEEGTSRSRLPRSTFLAQLSPEDGEAFCRWRRRQFSAAPPDDEFLAPCNDPGRTDWAVVEPLSVCIRWTQPRVRPSGFYCGFTVRRMEDCTLARARDRCDPGLYIDCMSADPDDCRTLPPLDGGP